MVSKELENKLEYWTDQFELKKCDIIIFFNEDGTIGYETFDKKGKFYISNDHVTIEDIDPYLSKELLEVSSGLPPKNWAEE